MSALAPMDTTPMGVATAAPALGTCRASTSTAEAATVDPSIQSGLDLCALRRV